MWTYLYKTTAKIKYFGRYYTYIFWSVGTVYSNNQIHQIEHAGLYNNID